jgi:beta-N-acetylhexosaminidase
LGTLRRVFLPLSSAAVTLFLHPDLSAQVSLREKIGQMVMVTVTGDSLEKSSPSLDTLKSDLDQGLVGGLILFNWSGNLKNPDQIAHFTQELQKRARTPLFLAIDQEGGRVARLNASNGFQATASAYTLGTILNLESATRQTAGTMAQWLWQMGLNMNLAPVVDVNVNPASPAIGAVERSFSTDADTVALHASWFIDEFHKRGIITTLKHFPGHGSATGDSHLGFTDVTTTWTSIELVPYRRLMAAHLVEAVMTAHVFNATIDTLYPATLSTATITGILRNELGYQGVVVSDEMGMKAISSQFGFDEAIGLALNAGVDLLLYNKNLDSTGSSLARHVVDYVEQKVLEGEIAPLRIEESYDRIMALKSRYLVSAPVRITAAMPASWGLSNYPNPFNGSTQLVVSVRARGSAELQIFDLLGRAIATLLHQDLEAGEHRVVWDARDMPSGVYLARLTVAQHVLTARILLLR